MVVGSLISEEDHPPLERFGRYLRRSFDKIGFHISAKPVHDRTWSGRNHRNLLHTVLPAVESSRISVLDVADCEWVEYPLSAPSLGRPVGKKLESAVSRPPRHAAGASDKASAAADGEGGAADPLYLRVDIVARKNRPHASPIERLGRLGYGYQETGIGLVLMMILYMRDDPFPHHLGIRLEGRAPVVAEYVAVADLSDPPLIPYALSESHYESPVATGLPGHGGIEANETWIPDQVQIGKLANDLRRQEGRAVSLHRICIVNSNEHRNLGW